MPGWLDAVYPTRLMHCATVELSRALRETSGDLTVQEVLDAR